MECSGLFNKNIRVKEEPNDMSLIENNCDMADEIPDLKNFQLLPILQENSKHNLRKFNLNHNSKFDDDVEIVVECEDVKPNFNSLTVMKIKDDTPNLLRNLRDIDVYKTQNIIKTEPMGEVKNEVFDDDLGKSNLNFDRKLVEKNKKRSKKKFNNEHNLESHIDTVNRIITHACDICGKKFTKKHSLKVHIDVLHRGVRHVCDICGKKFSTKKYLMVHTDVKHRSVTYKVVQFFHN
uniref:C2H2-type domain-containing protein n=1 Tax=Trichogramma kaykai TaxID=54128 RepID=A0ABD2WT10_9HYME